MQRKVAENHALQGALQHGFVVVRTVDAPPSQRAHDSQPSQCSTESLPDFDITKALKHRPPSPVPTPTASPPPSIAIMVSEASASPTKKPRTHASPAESSHPADAASSVLPKPLPAKPSAFASPAPSQDKPSPCKPSASCTPSPAKQSPAKLTPTRACVAAQPKQIFEGIVAVTVNKQTSAKIRMVHSLA